MLHCFGQRELSGIAKKAIDVDSYFEGEDNAWSHLESE